MARYKANEVVRIDHPGTPVTGREAVVISSEVRQDNIVYFLDVEGDDCSWVLPESSLAPTGRAVDRPIGWDGARFCEGDHVKITAKCDSAMPFSGQTGTVLGKVLDSDLWWCTIETESGDIVILRDDEIELSGTGSDDPGRGSNERNT